MNIVRTTHTHIVLEHEDIITAVKEYIRKKKGISIPENAEELSTADRKDEIKIEFNFTVKDLIS